MPVQENPGFGTAFAEGLFGEGVPAFKKSLSDYLEEARQRQAMSEFLNQVNPNVTVPAPTAPGAPIPTGSNGQPLGLKTPDVTGVPTQERQPLDMSDPRFMAAAMRLASQPGGDNLLNRYLAIKGLGAPTPEKLLAGETYGTVNKQTGKFTPQYTAPPKIPVRSLSDKKVSSRVGPNNIMYNMMQTPTNEFYEVEAGPARQTSMSVMGTGQGFDAKAIAKAISNGEQPPTMEGLSRGQGGVVKSELAKIGYNQALAEQDWKATIRHFATLNGTQQTRLRQAAMTAKESLDIIDNLADKWNGGKFPILNKANIILAKNGALGSEAQNIATQLEAQIVDVQSEMSNVYMGGNSPTDQALQLAGKNLDAAWARGQLKSATNLARKNLIIRLNSIQNTGVIGATDKNQYGGGAGTPQATPTPTGSQKFNVNGKIYDIPANEVQEFLKDFPNAQRQ